MPVITVDKIEVIFEKQPTANACKWLVLIKVRKKNKERIALIAKTNYKPLVNFLDNKINVIEFSNKIKNKIIKNHK
jgi:hypothetical protein